jgi:hypothetical protein
VRVGERHYVICRNLIEARRDAEVRETVLRSLRVSRRRQGAGSAEAPFDVISRPRTKCTSRSTTAGWRTTPNMMVSCPANQHHPEPARRHASMSRAAQGGGHLQNDKIHSRHQADLSSKGCRNPRPRLSLVPGARPAQASGRPLAAARSRLKSEWGALLMDLDRLQEIENTNRARGQALHPARCRSRLPGRRRRAAAQHPGGRRRRINPLNSISLLNRLI